MSVAGPAGEPMGARLKTVTCAQSLASGLTLKQEKESSMQYVWTVLIIAVGAWLIECMLEGISGG